MSDYWKARKMFDQLDLNRNGLLTIEEVYEAFQTMGIPADLEEIKKDFSKFDDNGDGRLNFDEFWEMIKLCN